GLIGRFLAWRSGRRIWSRWIYRWGRIGLYDRRSRRCALIGLRPWRRHAVLASRLPFGILRPFDLDLADDVLAFVPRFLEVRRDQFVNFAYVRDLGGSIVDEHLDGILIGSTDLALRAVLGLDQHGHALRGQVDLLGHTLGALGPRRLVALLIASRERRY